MKREKQAPGRIQLVFRRSHPLTKVVALCAVVLCIAALLTLRGAILDSRRRTEALRNQAALLEQENQQLQENISMLGTVESIERIAREVLGLVDPDTVIFTPQP